MSAYSAVAQIDYFDLLRLARPEVKERGKRLRSKVGVECIAPTSMIFNVDGTAKVYQVCYQVSPAPLPVRGKSVSTTKVGCTCPYSNGYEGICKHIVATALYCQKYEPWLGMPEEDEASDEQLTVLTDDDQTAYQKAVGTWSPRDREGLEAASELELRFIIARVINSGSTVELGQWIQSVGKRAAEDPTRPLSTNIVISDEPPVNFRHLGAAETRRLIRKVMPTKKKTSKVASLDNALERHRMTNTVVESNNRGAGTRESAVEQPSAPNLTADDLSFDD